MVQLRYSVVELLARHVSSWRQTALGFESVPFHMLTQTLGKCDWLFCPSSPFRG